MVAVLAQQIVLAPHKPGRHALHCGVDFGRRQEADPVQDAAAEDCAGGRGERWSVVDAGFRGVRVAPVGVFDSFSGGGGGRREGYAGVVQRGAQGPEDGA